MRQIDADALLQKGIKVTVYGVTDTDVLNRMMSAFREAVINAPTVKAEPEHGHWIINGEWCTCSECKQSLHYERSKGKSNLINALSMAVNFCPSCGAKMDEKTTRVQEKTCYNCCHGGYGFDSDLGCSLWHKGKADAETCEYWEGAKDGKND